MVLEILDLSPRVLQHLCLTINDEFHKFMVIFPSFQGRPLPRQPSNQKNKDRGPPQRQINISISKDVELLHKAKDAWKPSHKDDEKKEKETDEETDAKTAVI